MLRASRLGDPSCDVSCVAAYRSTISRRFGLVSRAVLLSHAASSLYSRMQRALAFSCGAAGFWLQALGAGRCSVRGAMSMCVQPRC